MKTGHDAIEFAEQTGTTLNKYEDPVEEARSGLTVEEAREIASEDPSLIWVEDETEDLTLHNLTTGEPIRKLTAEEVAHYNEISENGTCEGGTGSRTTATLRKIQSIFRAKSGATEPRLLGLLLPKWTAKRWTL